MSFADHRQNAPRFSITLARFIQPFSNCCDVASEVQYGMMSNCCRRLAKSILQSNLAGSSMLSVEAGMNDATKLLCSACVAA